MKRKNLEIGRGLFTANSFEKLSAFIFISKSENILSNKSVINNTIFIYIAIETYTPIKTIKSKLLKSPHIGTRRKREKKKQVRE